MNRDVDKPVPRRQPPKINVRPGKGGHQRTRKLRDAHDPTEGLSAFGEIIPQAATGGALVFVLELDPQGNAGILCRLSSEEDQEQFLLQLDPCLALTKRFPEELRPRYALFAMNMPGTRAVRPDRVTTPPPPGEYERDDMLIVDRWMEEGWLEHIIARGGDRIAREVLPAETLLNRWSKNGVSLWLARHGRKMDYRADRLALRAEMMVSAEERAWLTTRAQAGMIDKGPMAGNGWPGHAPFGFVYDAKARSRHEDPEQWPFILRAFELADSSDCMDGAALSTRKVTEQLSAEGCPFDHDRVRTILQNVIYATGEYTTVVRGIPIPQTPIPLEHPVPLDRFQRVQDLLALRQGSTKRTPLGEFLLNYVPFKHKRCDGATSNRDIPIRIKGYVIDSKNEALRRYRHAPAVPDCCKSGGPGPGGSWTWEREQLERPVVEAVRELANHPEVLRQLALAERHGLIESSPRLSEAQRAEIEHQLADLEQQREAAVDTWIDAQVAAGAPSLDEYRRLMEGFKRRIEALERRIERDSEAAAREQTLDGAQRKNRLETFLEILTVETPDDLRLKALRARLFQRIVSEMELEENEDGSLTITLYGHLVPGGAELDACDPLAAAADLLDAYERQKSGNLTASERELERVERLQSETDLSARASKSVSSVYHELFVLPSTEQQKRLQMQRIDDPRWHKATRHQRKSGIRAWSQRILIRR